VAVPQLVARRPRGRADGRVDDPRRRADEAGGLRRHARRHPTTAGGRGLLAAVHPAADAGQRRLRRVHRHAPEGPEVPHRLLQRQPHGAGVDGLRRHDHRRLYRRGHPDGQPRHHDRPLLLRRRHDLRPRPHPRHGRTERDAPRPALDGGGLHHRRSRQHGHARPIGLHRRVPHLPWRLERQQYRPERGVRAEPIQLLWHCGRHLRAGHHHHRGLRAAGRPVGILRRIRRREVARHAAADGHRQVRARRLLRHPDRHRRLPGRHRPHRHSGHGAGRRAAECGPGSGPIPRRNPYRLGSTPAGDRRR